jgi:uncharacterized Zn-finger protein
MKTLRICGCGKKYTSSAGLSRHIRLIHNGVRPSNTPIIKMGRPSVKGKVKGFRNCGCGK